MHMVPTLSTPHEKSTDSGRSVSTHSSVSTSTRSRSSVSSGHTLSRTSSTRTPELVMGYILKEGRRVKSWRLRFFVLESSPAPLSPPSSSSPAAAEGLTLLTYHLKAAEPGTGPPYGRREKGHLDLRGYTVEAVPGMERVGFLLLQKKILLRLSPPAASVLDTDTDTGVDTGLDRDAPAPHRRQGGGRVLRLAFDTEASREMWRDALNDHIAYANNYHHFHSNHNHSNHNHSHSQAQSESHSISLAEASSALPSTSTSSCSS